MLGNLNYARCLNIAPIEKTWFGLQSNILLLFIVYGLHEVDNSNVQ